MHHQHQGVALVLAGSGGLLVFQGYTIPLDKRLAADGRGLQSVHINENFAKLAESLYIADRKVSVGKTYLLSSA